jgi:hypothetical protein
MYQELFDKKHQFYRLTKPNPDSKNYSKLPTGEYEGNILCFECDNVQIGRLEDYARRVMYGGELKESEPLKVVNKVDSNGIRYTHIQNINYKKFKLFLLSILWRASISKRNFFSNVYLGPYEETIRQMIINEDPKEPYDFPCLLITIRRDEPIASQIIKSPTKLKEERCTKYHFFICGISYVFHVPKHNLPDYLFEGVINKSNEMKIFHIPKDKVKEALAVLLGF